MVPPGRARAAGQGPLPGLHAVPAGLAVAAARSAAAAGAATAPRRRAGELPALPAGRSPEVVAGGETAGRRRLERWLARRARSYGEGIARRDVSAQPVPPLRLPLRARGRRASGLGPASGVEAFVRQLCWRDFYAQLLAARPETASEDLRPRGDRWLDDEEALAAWKDGRTGYPLVDAGMRQLALEGWMHNRARLVTGSFLVKHLGIDWRVGARHYFDLLLDGDVAQNAATGSGSPARAPTRGRTASSTRPRRRSKLDPDGALRPPLRAGAATSVPGRCRTRPARAPTTRRRSSTTPKPWRRSGGDARAECARPRQEHAEGRAAAFLALDLDRAAALADDPVRRSRARGRCPCRPPWW